MPTPDAVANSLKALGEIVSIIFHPKNIKLREELYRLASYKKACAYAQEYMTRDDLISTTTDKDAIDKYVREKNTLKTKFTKTLVKN